MKIQVSIFTLILSLVVISSCTDKKENPTQENDEVVNEKPALSDTIYISDHYPEISLEIRKVIDSLRFCELIVDTSIPDSLQMYPCNNEYFGIYNNTAENWQNGFIMEAAQGVWAKSSRVFNIEKVDGSFLVTNDMKGQLLMMIPKENNKHDLVVRYFDSQVGTISILHQWKGKNYKPTEVLMINDYPIKNEFKDSLNTLYLDNFIWGY